MDKAICKRALDKIIIKMPLSDAMKVSQSIKKYVKDMVSQSFPITEHSVMMVLEEAIVMIHGVTLKLMKTGAACDRAGGRCS